MAIQGQGLGRFKTAGVMALISGMLYFGSSYIASPTISLVSVIVGVDLAILAIYDFSKNL